MLEGMLVPQSSFPYQGSFQKWYCIIRCWGEASFQNLTNNIMLPPQCSITHTDFFFIITIIFKTFLSTFYGMVNVGQTNVHHLFSSGNDFHILMAAGTLSQYYLYKCWNNNLSLNMLLWKHDSEEVIIISSFHDLFPVKRVEEINYFSIALSDTPLFEWFKQYFMGYNCSVYCRHKWQCQAYRHIIKLLTVAFKLGIHSKKKN